MATDVSVIDEYGRVLVPRDIRNKMKTREVVFLYDEKHGDIHMVPIRSFRDWKGRFKGILKDYMKTHMEDQYDPHRG